MKLVGNGIVRGVAKTKEPDVRATNGRCCAGTAPITASALISSSKVTVSFYRAGPACSPTPQSART